MSVANDPFQVIKGRYLIPFWFLPLFYLPGAYTLLDNFVGDLPWYWWDVGFYYYAHLIFAAPILLLGWISRLDWRSLFGKPPVKQDLIPSLKLTLFLFLFSIAAAYALFLPLSYLVPEFVQWWYIDLPDLIYFDDYRFPLAANMLSFISLVVLAPLLEEIAFRGYLLQRWSRTWGIIPAVLVSSLIFGIAHPDPIGAVAFGIGMAIIYLRTQSLFVPIICHAANNLLAWLLEAGYLAVEGPGYEYTLEDFQNEWVLGLACALVCIAWIIHYIRQPAVYRTWRLPEVRARSAGV